MSFEGDNRLSRELQSALAELLSAFQSAKDTESAQWDFAVSIRLMSKLGLTMTDLRWLVRKGFVEHAQEVTVLGENGRAFRPTGDLTFTRKTCFVLTEAGVARALQSNGQLGNAKSRDKSPHRFEEQRLNPVVHWDPDTRKLTVNGQIIKRFKWPAANQEAILSAFQEEGWPERIDDPLPPQPEQDSKRRLSDTIKCLNRKQTNHLLHFRGDGTGEGITWEFVEPDVEANGAV
jgi:hypothetical protein